MSLPKILEWSALESFGLTVLQAGFPLIGKPFSDLSVFIKQTKSEVSVTFALVWVDLAYVYI